MEDNVCDSRCYEQNTVKLNAEQINALLNINKIALLIIMLLFYFSFGLCSQTIE